MTPPPSAPRRPKPKAASPDRSKRATAVGPRAAKWAATFFDADLSATALVTTRIVGDQKKHRGVALVAGARMGERAKSVLHDLMTSTAGSTMSRGRHVEPLATGDA